MLEVQKALNSQSIFPRRYFYPSLSSLNYVSEQSTPISDDTAKRILCLPLYPNLNLDELGLITNIINTNS
jgi:dTDP-4-amino-4,6-dideoxygalactose transaminase